LLKKEVAKEDVAQVHEWEPVERLHGKKQKKLEVLPRSPLHASPPTAKPIAEVKH
jgi:hypothetical protein